MRFLVCGDCRTITDLDAEAWNGAECPNCGEDEAIWEISSSEVLQICPTCRGRRVVPRITKEAS